MRGKFTLLALVTVVALTAAACAEEADEPDAGPTEEETLPGAGMLACQVTDTGGIDDKSFNQTAYAGMERAETELGVEIDFLESQSQADYDPNIQAFIDRGCDIIVTVGFLLGDATQAAAEANPEVPFAIVDFAYDPPLDNVLGLVFSTKEAAFLAGYASASWTKTGTMGTYGGINIGPPVTDFMDGFFAGAMYYNEQNGTAVEVLGWDPSNPDAGLFTGDFDNQDNGRRVTEDLIAEGADVILPVAGPVGLGTAAAVEDSDQEDVMVGVDTDWCVSAEEYCPVVLTSVQKNMDVAVFNAVAAVVEGTFESGLYVGTLEDEGVGLAPFHEYEGQISDEVKADLDEIRAGIIDGSISVNGEDYL
ncbi:MAG TPA: BMP family ABC transporter substrate-binding protein [Actinomycetota bacterium]|nr:BMP family ABC transporter substrate-binding protein [Actinomycetota bacterium]